MEFQRDKYLQKLIHGKENNLVKKKPHFCITWDTICPSCSNLPTVSGEMDSFSVLTRKAEMSADSWLVSIIRM